tara:strand:+ start:58 stop:444 length:387 start_codon:yes stop_codon:yes gene_type:complete
MVSLFIGLFASIAMIAFAMISGGDMGAFIDLPAFLIVAGLAFFYSLASGGDFLERIENFGFGAVRAGWIGLLIGLVLIFKAHSNDPNLENMLPAFAVAFLTPFYGYVFQFITNMIVNHYDNQIETNEE